MGIIKPLCCISVHLFFRTSINYCTYILFEEHDPRCCSIRGESAPLWREQLLSRVSAPRSVYTCRKLFAYIARSPCIERGCTSNEGSPVNSRTSTQRTGTSASLVCSICAATKLPTSVTRHTSKSTFRLWHLCGWASVLAVYRCCSGMRGAYRNTTLHRLLLYRTCPVPNA